MAALKIGTYNVEHFGRLFVDDQPLTAGENASRRRQLEAIATVMERLDVDLLAIIEAPKTTQDGRKSTVAALEAFAAAFGLRQRKAAFGFPSRGGGQDLAFLFDPDRLEVAHAPGGVTLDVDAPGAEDAERLAALVTGRGLVPTPRFDGYFVLDTDSDTIDEVHSFYRPPFELAVTERASGRSFRAICVHTKSKINFDEFDRTAAENSSLRNRRKLLAQCLWVRYRVEELLAAGHEIVVLGDFNDGPGLDYYERRFGRSAIEIVMGDIGQPGSLLRNPHTRPSWKPGFGWRPYTASFAHPLARSRVRALLDFVLVSRGLAGGIADSAWEIWNDNHPAARQDQAFERALLRASDHFPVTVTLDL